MASPVSLAYSFFLSLLLQPAWLYAGDLTVDRAGRVHWRTCGPLFSPFFERQPNGRHALQMHNALFGVTEFMFAPLAVEAVQRVCGMDLPTILFELIADLQSVDGASVPCACMHVSALRLR